MVNTLVIPRTSCNYCVSLCHYLFSNRFTNNCFYTTFDCYYRFFGSRSLFSSLWYRSRFPRKQSYVILDLDSPPGDCPRHRNPAPRVGDGQTSVCTSFCPLVYEVGREETVGDLETFGLLFSRTNQTNNVQSKDPQVSSHLSLSLTQNSLFLVYSLIGRMSDPSFIQQGLLILLP